jgi:hypothetical protein
LYHLLWYLNSIATQSFPQFLIRSCCPFSLWKLHAIDPHLRSHTLQGLFFKGNNFWNKYYYDYFIVIILLHDRCNYNVRHTMTNKSDFFSHIIHTGGKTFGDLAFMSLFWEPSLSSDRCKIFFGGTVGNFTAN